MATMLPGVRPSISLASLPTASTSPVFLLMATIEGSLTTMPLPRAYTSVLAVPRSMARSLEKMLNRERRLWLRVGPEWNPLFDMTTYSVFLTIVPPGKFPTVTFILFGMAGTILRDTGQPCSAETFNFLLNHYLLLLRIHSALRRLRCYGNHSLSGWQWRGEIVELPVRRHHRDF